MPAKNPRITVTVSREFYWWLKHYQTLKGHASPGQALVEILEIGQRIVNEHPVEVSAGTTWGGNRNPEGKNGRD